MMLSTLTFLAGLAAPFGAPPAPVSSSPRPQVVTVRLNDDGQYAPGDRVRIEVRSTVDGHLLVLHADPAGRVRVLFPLSPEDDAYVRAGRNYQLRDRNNERDLFRAVAGSNQGTILAAVAEEPFSVADVSDRDRWKYEVLAPNRVGDDMEGDLLSIVRRVAGDGFEYGLASYVVSEERYIASGGYWGPGWGGGWGWGVSPWLWGAGFGWGGWGWGPGWGGGWGWGAPVIVGPGGGGRFSVPNRGSGRGGSFSSPSGRVGGGFSGGGGGSRGGGGGGGGGGRSSGRR